MSAAMSAAPRTVAIRLFGRDFPVEVSATGAGHDGARLVRARGRGLPVSAAPGAAPVSALLVLDAADGARRVRDVVTVADGVDAGTLDAFRAAFGAAVAQRLADEAGGEVEIERERVEWLLADAREVLAHADGRIAAMRAHLANARRAVAERSALAAQAEARGGAWAEIAEYERGVLARLGAEADALAGRLAGMEGEAERQRACIARLEAALVA